MSDSRGLRPIQRVERYRLLERLGQGRASSVFRAYDPTLDRVVAVKIMAVAGELIDPVRTHFYRAARSWARLNHPNIVTMYDVGEDRGRLFVVMEFLQGPLLRQLLVRPIPMPLNERLTLLMQICDGLAHAHKHGVVYRELNAEKVMVLTTGQAKLLDFGIAHFDGPAGRSPDAAPHPGTPPDIRSLGALFYELVTSQPLRSTQEPSGVVTSAALVERQVSRDLAAVIQRALGPNTDGRAPTLAEMRAQVERQLAEETRWLVAKVQAELVELRDLKAALTDRLSDERQGQVFPQAHVGIEELIAEVQAEWAAREAELRTGALLDVVPPYHNRAGDPNDPGAQAGLEARSGEALRGIGKRSRSRGTHRLAVRWRGPGPRMAIAASLLSAMVLAADAPMRPSITLERTSPAQIAAPLSGSRSTRLALRDQPEPIPSAPTAAEPRRSSPPGRSAGAVLHPMIGNAQTGPMMLPVEVSGSTVAPVEAALGRLEARLDGDRELLSRAIRPGEWRIDPVAYRTDGPDEPASQQVADATARVQPGLQLVAALRDWIRRNSDSTGPISGSTHDRVIESR